jgi:hypothetical protein
MIGVMPGSGRPPGMDGPTVGSGVEMFGGVSTCGIRPPLLILSMIGAIGKNRIGRRQGINFPPNGEPVTMGRIVGVGGPPPAQERILPCTHAVTSRIDSTLWGFAVP